LTLVDSFESKRQAVGINAATSYDYKTAFRHQPKLALSLLHRS